MIYLNFSGRAEVLSNDHLLIISDDHFEKLEIGISRVVGICFVENGS